MIWAIWLVAVMIVFLVIEVFALTTRRIKTLSATIWELTKRQPILPFVLGLATGILVIHLFGNGWCPS